ncbi:hypothetical protein GIB67_042724 [Kingdonia uniflora]|uniref:Uncharacterized protein n=1 Tax=Kingdonia uniflora TaxID=39325 RepID=A0A7J7NEL6_9MAGN|nr:hypothetical protein GIB67_042724 [Kingdonia uniflora]
MFVALPEEEKGTLRATCFAPLLLIDPIVTMSTLVVEIFDRHLGDMKFQFGEMIIQMKPFIRCSSIKFVKNYTILSPPGYGEKRLGERHQIEAPIIGTAPTIDTAPAIGAPAVGAPAIGYSSSAIKIRAVVVRVCSQLEGHGKMLLKLDDHSKMLHNHGKMLERISMSTMGDSTLPLRDTPLLG